MRIERISEMSDSVLDLAAVARNGGYKNIDTLTREYRSGLNRFQDAGEGLFGVVEGGRLLGIGGLNIDPYENSRKVGRIRRLYVHPASRRDGVASLLMRKIEALATQNFSRVQLFTTSSTANRFYTSLGYRVVESREKVSHEKQLNL